jgi:hypothetical protein
LLSLLALNLTERTDKVAIGVARVDGPGVNGDHDLLVNKGGSLTSAKTDAGKSAREGSSKHCLLRERGESRLGERGAVNVTNVSTPVALCDTDNASSGKDVFGCLLGTVFDVHLLLLLILLLLETSAFVALNVIVLECNWELVCMARIKLTILVEDLVSRSLPLGLGKKLDNN